MTVVLTFQNIISCSIIVVASREQMYAYCRALGCCLYEMCSRQKLFPVRQSHTVSAESDGRTLPQFPQQFSADLAGVWHRWVKTFNACALEVQMINVLQGDRNCEAMWVDCGLLINSLLQALHIHSVTFSVSILIIIILIALKWMPRFIVLFVKEPREGQRGTMPLTTWSLVALPLPELP